MNGAGLPAGRTSLTASQKADCGSSVIPPCATGAAQEGSGESDGDALTQGGDGVRPVALGADWENLWVCNHREWQAF